MKNNQVLIGKVIIGISIVIAALILSEAIRYAGGTIGSQIAAAIGNLQP